MRTLRDHVTRHLLASWALFAAVIGVLFFLVRLIDELERVTTVYTASKVIMHVMLTLPQHLVMLTPVIVLMGALAAFARLEQLNELTIIRGCGVSKTAFLGMLVRPLLLLTLLLWASMQWVCPPLHQWGEEIRSEARGNNALDTGQSLWSRNEGTFYRLGRLGARREPGDLDIFQFSAGNRLQRAVHAERVEVIEERRWRLYDALVRHWNGETLVVERVPELIVDDLWTREELDRLLLSPNSMSLSMLYRYQEYLQRSGQSAHAQALALWNRLLLPAAAVAMVVLAWALSVKPASRRGRMGRELALGVLVGVLFYLGSQSLMALGQIYSLSPFGTALSPILLMLLSGLLLLRRRRW